MPVTFGSVGDIIAVCLLIKDLVKTLDESRGASAEYQEVVRELWVLERALLEVEMLSRACDNTLELNALCATARRAADDCRKSIEVFLEKIRGYSASLRSGGSGNVLKDASKKVKWQISQKEDLTRFRAEINAHSTSINMLLMTASVGLIKINDSKLGARMTQKEVEDRQANSEQMKLLREINKRLEDQSMTHTAHDPRAMITFESQRWRWLVNLSTGLKEHMRKIFRLNVQTYNSVMRIESTIMGHLEKTLIQEPFILEDAIGRLAPVHMQFVSSWEAFDAVLALRFQNFPGEQKIKRKEFVLQDHATNREIDRSFPWEASFVPGQRVDMSMLFVNQEAATTSCPKCRTPSSSSPDTESQCAGCGMWYRRITEYVDVDAQEGPSRVPVTSPVEFKETRFGESSTDGESLDEEEDPASRDRDNEDVINTDSISLFKRVRVISQENRVKSNPVASVVEHEALGKVSAPVVTTAEPRVRGKASRYVRDDFDLMRVIGVDKISTRYAAQSRHNQRFYALKIFKKSEVVRQKSVGSVNDENVVLQEVKHPFIATMWGTFQDQNNLYMIMDFAQGGELFSLLRRSQRFPDPVAKFYSAEITLALDYLHSKNIIFRNLNPSSILLSRVGHVKLTDFGLAKCVPDITWTLCGQPDYTAPEIVASKGYNKSIDWWSLGVVIFEMLCGFTPFWDAGSPVKIYENILKGQVRYPPYINPDALNLLQQLITPDLTKRLGNLWGGSMDIMNHPWFAEVSWFSLAKLDVDAPWVPPLTDGAGDTSQFDRYPDLSIDEEEPGNDSFSHLFPDF